MSELRGKLRVKIVRVRPASSTIGNQEGQKRWPFILVWRHDGRGIQQIFITSSEVRKTSAAVAVRDK